MPLRRTRLAARRLASGGPSDHERNCFSQAVWLASGLLERACWHSDMPNNAHDLLRNAQLANLIQEASMNDEINQLPYL